MAMVLQAAKVDNDFAVRFLNNTLCNNLNMMGYTVDAALSKQMAMNFIEKQDYDLIVLDVNLPDGNGFDFCQEAKERRLDAASDEEFRVQVGSEDYKIDLLFFHRGLQCLVAFELKIGKFKPEYIENGFLFGSS